jgi:esterase
LGSKTNFRSIAQHPTLNEEADVVTVDLRNHGDSFHHHDCSLPTMAEDIHALADHLLSAGSVQSPSGSIDIVGHSLGGKVAMALALLYPRLVRRLVVVDIAPFNYPTGNASWTEISSIVRSVANIDPSHFKTRREGEAALAASGVPASHRGFILQNLVPDGPAKYRWRCNLPALAASLEGFAQFPFGELLHCSDLTRASTCVRVQTFLPTRTLCRRPRSSGEA